MAITFGLGDLIQVRLNFELAERFDRAMNVLHYRIATQSGTPPAISAGLSAIGSAMYDKWGPLWDQAASDQVRFASVTSQNVFPLPRSVGVTFSPGVPRTGEEVSDPMPLQDAPTLLKTTDIGQRWGLGRLFYCGLAENQQAGGTLAVAALAALQDMALALKDAVSVSAGAWAVTLEPVLVRGPSDNPVSLTKITGGRLSDPFIKTQRRRRPGKGS